ncbi:hypothetical protein VTN96DRAFT_6075 [Rasamsonia emersonii]
MRLILCVYEPTIRQTPIPMIKICRVELVRFTSQNEAWQEEPYHAGHQQQVIGPDSRLLDSSRVESQDDREHAHQWQDDTGGEHIPRGRKSERQVSILECCSHDWDRSARSRQYFVLRKLGNFINKREREGGREGPLVHTRERCSRCFPRCRAWCVG